MHYLTILGVILIATGTFCTYVGQNRNNEQSTKKLDAEISELINGKDQLLEQNNDLILQIEKYQDDLGKKNKIIKGLEEKAKKAERGITGVYDFQGNYRSTSPGCSNINVGVRAEEFNCIAELNTSKSWLELSELCEKEIKATPEWLTPYFFAGIARANLGHRVRALELFKHVQTNAAGDPEYAKVDEFLKRLSS